MIEDLIGKTIESIIVNNDIETNVYLKLNDGSTFKIYFNSKDGGLFLNETRL